MITEDYANACAEVVRILDYIPYRDYRKIPKEVILHYEKNANKNYNFEYDTKLSLDEQNVSKTAKTIIAIFFRDYWATTEQKNRILNYEKYENIKEEEIKSKKYNPDNLFKKVNKQEKNIKQSNLNNVAMVKYEESMLKKIWNKILSIFKN